MSGSVDTLMRQCCCGDNCQCGASCGLNKSDQRGKNEPNSRDVVLRDQGKINTSAARLFVGLGDHASLCESLFAVPLLGHAATSLLHQHTLLRV
jgi:hypothetical protein